MNTTRRKFIENSLKATVLVAGAPIIASTAKPLFTPGLVSPPSAFQFAQIALPYGYNALEPSIDATTMDIHYNKHHAAYVKNVNEAITAEKISYTNENDFFKKCVKAFCES